MHTASHLFAKSVSCRSAKFTTGDFEYMMRLKQFILQKLRNMAKHTYTHTEHHTELCAAIDLWPYTRQKGSFPEKIIHSIVKDVTFRANFITWDPSSFSVLEIELIQSTFYYLNTCVDFQCAI